MPFTPSIEAAYTNFSDLYFPYLEIVLRYLENYWIHYVDPHASFKTSAFIVYMTSLERQFKTCYCFTLVLISG